MNRASRQEGGPRKQVKLSDNSCVHSIPPTHAEDEVSYGHNLELLKSKMSVKCISTYMEMEVHWSSSI